MIVEPATEPIIAVIPNIKAEIKINPIGLMFPNKMESL